ncbi:MAG: helix-turn-helix transcriptional regulator [Bacillota bacterium]|jgi:DNA-binding CsgD family transcriptional regulator/MFS family permease|nr:helix-turn-helix transcriptional regulator [Bacillota bacterium]HPZ14237.1 helix-turn-helix transcriptional regulator [Bacillota bacterium]HQD80409.1 helix-turn-helix transcriptional regulator [Bacillota bacterium]
MADGRGSRALHVSLDERKLSVIVLSLFSSWMLAFLFEGQILYALLDSSDVSPSPMVFGGVAANFAGLFLCGFLIKTKKAARRLFLCSCAFFIAASAIFFFPLSVFWRLGVITSSFLAGACVAAWGFYFKSGTPKNERTKTAADVLICSNLLMTLLNVVAIHLSPIIGLALSMIVLFGAFIFALRLPADDDAAFGVTVTTKEEPVNIAGSLALLCLFILIITINSGLMYEVINPAFAHHEWLTSWYWAMPYVVAVYAMRNPALKINRTYMLYVALAMIGFSFIAFVFLNRSAMSYLVVNTLMLGACGIYDLFWWTILGEMLDYCKNPATVFGIGLSANVLGVLLGGLIGKAISSAGTQAFNSTLLALAVVCVTLALLPPLHRRLYSLLKDHAYRVMFSEISPWEQSRLADQVATYENLSERERQVASLLLQRKTYKMIASELFISENTVKYYVKNIYSKLGIKSREELIDMVLATTDAAATKE